MLSNNLFSPIAKIKHIIAFIYLCVSLSVRNAHYYAYANKTSDQSQAVGLLAVVAAVAYGQQAVGLLAVGYQDTTLNSPYYSELIYANQTADQPQSREADLIVH